MLSIGLVIWGVVELLLTLSAPLPAELAKYLLVFAYLLIIASGLVGLYDLRNR